MAPEEIALIQRAQRGDSLAFEQLVFEHDRHVLGIIARYVTDAEDAKDLYQEVFIKVYRGLTRFRFESEFTTWLYRIAVNEALMLMRKRKPQTISVEENTPYDAEGESEEMEIVDFCCLPEGELLSSESRRFLDQAVQNLPGNLRVVFVMRDLEGLSIQETAEALNISENNVKTRLLRARLHLRQELSVYFGGKVQEESRR